MKDKILRKLFKKEKPTEFELLYTETDEGNNINCKIHTTNARPECLYRCLINLIEYIDEVGLNAKAFCRSISEFEGDGLPSISFENIKTDEEFIQKLGNFKINVLYDLLDNPQIPKNIKEEINKEIKLRATR